MAKKWILILLVARVGIAESSGNPSNSNSPTPVKRDAITVFSDNVFDVGKWQEEEEKSEGRSRAKDSEFNSGQTEKMKSNCESFRRREDMEGYRRCYADQQRRTSQNLKSDIEAVEKRQSGGPQNTYPLQESGPLSEE